MKDKDTFDTVAKGVAGNTLRTLGRSLFNSTVGTIGNAQQIKAMNSLFDKIASEFSSEEEYDNEAVSGRLKGQSAYDVLRNMSIEDSVTFMNENRKLMERLMAINKNEKEITLNALGVEAIGSMDTFRNARLYEYEQAEGNNYYTDFVKGHPSARKNGDDTTQMTIDSHNYNYAGLHNELYGKTENLYPDERDTGNFTNKWLVENQNSILYKTKQTFLKKKNKTIISAFHTDPSSADPSALGDARSKYGLSHGRNLLRKDAEQGLNSYSFNGYDNPYCRVWTHHYQYDRLYKTMRAFHSIDDRGAYEGTIPLVDFHVWGDSKTKPFDVQTGDKFGWKSQANNGWKLSVLNQTNGLLNIAPKFQGGGAKNLHTKQCMFSIENLAWRGYDPYQFERSLSWEQRGPLGGRIMWFPPYNIKFSETTQAAWNNSTFIGRGEEVYTYSHTTRTGQLQFSMLVDHPSLIDYVSWGDGRDISDTDLLRFFAGCDGGLTEKAKPTPLTDEWIEPRKIVDEYEEGNPELEPIPPKEPTLSRKKICFFAFFPNNYSGVYDDGKEFTPRTTKTSIDSKHELEVDPILYLLLGKGAQKRPHTDTNEEYNIPLNDREYKETGSGYEMSGGGISVGTDNAILYPKGHKFRNGFNGGSFRWWQGLKHGGNGNDQTQYAGDKVDSGRVWQYRIDGYYGYPKDTNEEKIHTYNQYFTNTQHYKDIGSNKFNTDVNSLLGSNFAPEPNLIKKGEGEQEKDILYKDDYEVFSLSEIAIAFYECTNSKDDLVNAIKGNSVVNEERINKLKDYLDNGRIESVKVSGYASAAGYDNCNQLLAKNRAISVGNWLQRAYGSATNLEVGEARADTSANPRSANGKNVSGDNNNKTDKSWRSAKVEIEIEYTEKQDLVENTEADNEIYRGMTKVEGETIVFKGQICEIWEDHKKEKWIKYHPDPYNDPITVKWFKFVQSVEILDGEPIQRYGGDKNDVNNVRYDQEYYFFKKLEETAPVVYQSLMDKIKYFDPAFHSMTPEGFNGRLTFLQQCMRQGETVSASEGGGARNLAFGRAPYCVLRLGDFYYQTIVIDNISITYDPLVWDLNVEGIGVQPLLANVTINFKFVGGSDMSGPVRRLQSAMSFNYYANARLYDNRADRVERIWNDETNGALEYGEKMDSSSFHAVPMYKAVGK